MTRFVLVFCFLSAFAIAHGQRTIDVLHYKYEIELSDASDSIKGRATIRVRFLESVTNFSLDVKSLTKEGIGLIASLDKVSMATAASIQKEDKLIILLAEVVKAGDERTYVINYKGIPGDGLIISKNKFGKRTFFSDNWPNRARYWIPCVDDPADKASVEFIVTAPAHYRIVSNGILIEEMKLPGDKQLSHWKEDVPLPTKIMVIGAAEFAVKELDTVQGVPVSIWVFAENQRDGFKDYAPASEILSFFTDYIGPFPYKKLANVQSQTIFGGMENASVIFYAENSVDGKQDHHTLLAHEIAHQWFGDMVTEKNFSHLWLSEGFATFMETYFNEKKFGIEKAKEMLEQDRTQAIAFSKMSVRPVVDSVSSLMELLNANSYQKGGWVLHMLRRQLGDSVFHKGIQVFYTTYKGKNVDTRDLQHVFEMVSGKDLSAFFNQWLYTPGIPKLSIEWKYNTENQKLDVTVIQLQKNVFQFPLELLIQTSSRSIEKLNITQATETFSIPVVEKPTRIKADPDVNLLFEGNVKEIKKAP
jgi:aminopeptidase N